MTIRINNILHGVTPPYGCHSTRAPERFEDPLVFRGTGTDRRNGWPHVMSTDCRYDRRATDSRCLGCQHD